MKDFITGVVLFAAGILSYFWVVPNGVESFGDSPSIALSASFWPYLIVVGFSALGFLLLMQGFFNWIKNAGKEKAHVAIPWAMAIAILLLFPYYYLAEQAGFVVASMFAFAMYALLAGEKNYKSLACFTVVVPIVITVFFTQVAQVLVPLGPFSSLFS